METTADIAPVARKIRGPNGPRSLTAKEERFCQLLVGGTVSAQAWRQAYHKPNSTAHNAAVWGSRLTRRPEVAARIADLRGRQEKKVLLTLNDRLGILANIAQSKTVRPADKTRAIDVYSKLAGDHAPERVELSGPNGAPMQTETVAPLSIRDRAAQLMAAKRRAKDDST